MPRVKTLKTAVPPIGTVDVVDPAGLVRSRIGRSMVAVRDNETAAAVMGVNLFTVKTVVFGLSGAIAGVAGSLYALKLTLVDAVRTALAREMEDDDYAYSWRT